MIIRLVENFSDENEIGKKISLDELKRFSEENVYNIRTDEIDVNKKFKIGQTIKDISLIVASKKFKEIYIQNIYNRDFKYMEK